MTFTPYASPRCEIEYYLQAVALLAGSDLTDDGAGDTLFPGEEYTL